MIQAYFKKQDKSQRNNLTLQIRELEKEVKPRVSRRKDIIKIRVERIERLKRQQKRSMKLRAGSWKENRSLARLTKKKKIGRAQMNKLRNEREVTTDTTEIHRIIKNTKSNYMSTN